MKWSWHWEDQDTIAIQCEEEGTITKLYRASGTREVFTDEMMEARAWLIAAAPEMLEALKDVGTWTGKGGPRTPWQDIVKDVGQKARDAIRIANPK